MWEITNIDLGTIVYKPNIKAMYNFKYIGNKRIKNFEPSCNCLNLKFKNNILNASWKIKKHHETYVSTKWIIVQYDDNTSEQLNISITITK